jgi:hypothetical protein
LKVEVAYILYLGASMIMSHRILSVFLSLTLIFQIIPTQSISPLQSIKRTFNNVSKNITPITAAIAIVGLLSGGFAVYSKHKNATSRSQLECNDTLLSIQDNSAKEEQPLDPENQPTLVPVSNKIENLLSQQLAQIGGNNRSRKLLATFQRAAGPNNRKKPSRNHHRTAIAQPYSALVKDEPITVTDPLASKDTLLNELQGALAKRKPGNSKRRSYSEVVGTPEGPPSPLSKYTPPTYDLGDGSSKSDGDW